MAASNANGCCEGALQRPTSPEALAQECGRKSQFAVPLLHIHGAPPKGDWAVVVPSVVGLDRWVDPTAVSGFVPPRAVDSINAKSQGARSHVAQECFEGVAPFSAHLDALSAIPGVVLSCWVEASAPSAKPDPIFSGSCSSMSLVSLSGSVRSKTSTTLGLSQTKAGACNHNFFAARTAASPTPTTVKAGFLGRKGNDSQPTKAVSGLVPQHGTIVTQKGYI